jgi:hypothetical protein
MVAIGLSGMLKIIQLWRTQPALGQDKTQRTTNHFPIHSRLTTIRHTLAPSNPFFHFRSLLVSEGLVVFNLLRHR